MSSKPFLKLNLGCGPSGLKGWLNYDWGILPLLSKFPWLRRILIRLGCLPEGYDLIWPPLQLVDIRKKLPLDANTVQLIYCSHVLEHLERWEALKVLKEAYRILVPGGFIRIVVPDLALICKIYLSTSLTSNPPNRPAQDACRLLWGHPKDIQPANCFVKWSRWFIRSHQWAYDQSEMRHLLFEAGFSEIRSCKFREGLVPNLDQLDLELHAPHSLYIEANKTPSCQELS